MSFKSVDMNVQVWREAEVKAYNAGSITQIQLIKPCDSCYIVRYRRGALDELNVPTWGEWFSKYFDNFIEALDEYKIKLSTLS